VRRGLLANGKEKGDALSTLPPACVQKGGRACRRGRVQPGERGLLPVNGKEGVARCPFCASGMCAKVRAGRARRGEARQGRGQGETGLRTAHKREAGRGGAGDRLRAGGGFALPRLHPRLREKDKGMETGCA